MQSRASTRPTTSTVCSKHGLLERRWQCVMVDDVERVHGPGHGDVEESEPSAVSQGVEVDKSGWFDQYNRVEFKPFDLVVLDDDRHPDSNFDVLCRAEFAQ